MDAAASLWVLKPQCQTVRDVEIHIKLLKKGLELRWKTYIGSVNYKGDKTVFSNEFSKEFAKKKPWITYNRNIRWLLEQSFNGHHIRYKELCEVIFLTCVLYFLSKQKSLGVILCMLFDLIFILFVLSFPNVIETLELNFVISSLEIFNFYHNFFAQNRTKNAKAIWLKRPLLQ